MTWSSATEAAGPAEGVGPQDAVVSRLVARIAELEDQLYSPLLRAPHQAHAPGGACEGLAGRIACLIGRTVDVITGADECRQRTGGSTCEVVWEGDNPLTGSGEETGADGRSAGDGDPETARGGNPESDSARSQHKRIAEGSGGGEGAVGNQGECRGGQVEGASGSFGGPTSATGTEGKLEAAFAEIERLKGEVDGARSRLTGAEAALGEARADVAMYQERFLAERRERRRVHDELQSLRGNMRVLCRVRPPAGGAEVSVWSPLPGALVVASSRSRREVEFEFSCVLTPSASQQDVFAEVHPFIRSCADGHNTCIMAYGQTGSGKTYTMEGPPHSQGIISQALETLLSMDSQDSVATVTISMVEIYNEAVRDLLAPCANGPKPLEVSGLSCGQGDLEVERIPGLIWRDVGGSDDLRRVMREGSKNRVTAATALNAHSSRSHTVVFVRPVPRWCHTNGDTVQSGESSRRPGILCLVDLAGSERVDKSEAKDERLREAQCINKSLSALGDVISAMQHHSPHVPFRNSKLTQVIQDCLCGKVLLVCNLSPEKEFVSETLSTLNFAQRASLVTTGTGSHGQGKNKAGTILTGAAFAPSSKARQELKMQ